jgi:hypothetical protein
MLGSGSRIRPVNQAGASTLVPCCPTRQHRVKTAEVCADWAFVLAVSPVSANLKIIDSIQSQAMRNRGWALFGALAPALRQVRLIQRPRSFVVRQQEWDTRETPETHALARACRKPRVAPAQANVAYLEANEVATVLIKVARSVVTGPALYGGVGAKWPICNVGPRERPHVPAVTTLFANR